MSSIVICEKPSQARNVREAIGNRYGRVLAARGHIIRLALPHEVNPDWKNWSFDVLRPAAGFYPLRPDTTHGKGEVIKEFKTALASAQRVIIATDCDREGQAIGENLLRFLKFKGEVFRAMFSAEDVETLREAFASMKPNEEFRPLYQAAVARAQADQIANLTATRVVTLALQPRSMRGAIGVGRVKTPTMGIVCRRELEIRSFTPRDYYDLWMRLDREGESVDLKAKSTEENRIFNEADALQAVERLKGWECQVHVEKARKNQAPPKLLDLPTMQQRAARWGWSAQKTLDVAQSLYETHKITTYPRAENAYLPEVEIENAPRMLDTLRGLPFVEVSYSSPTIRKGKKGHFSDAGLAGSSHHAIVPNVRTSDTWGAVWQHLSTDEQRLFELIARTYLAAIGPDRVYDRTEFWVEAFKRRFNAVGVVDRELGWKEAMGAAQAGSDDDSEASDDDKADDNALPDWPDNTAASVGEAGSTKKTTLPPPRYTEGSLIKAMQEAWRFAESKADQDRLKEAKGIGTPATRGSILEGLKKQGFFEIKKNQIQASELALAIYDILTKEVPEILDPAVTAEMEMALDEIMQGKQDPRTVVEHLVERSVELAAKMKSRAAAGGPLDINVKSPPSKKMLEAVKAKAKREGVAVPRGSSGDASICQKFLGPRPEGNNPSEAQLNFARKIAEGASIEIPDAALTNRGKLTKWIDGNKEKLPKDPSSEIPSSKQVGFAEQIAERKGIEIPPETLRSRSMLSKWIDTHAGARNAAKGMTKGRRKAK